MKLPFFSILFLFLAHPVFSQKTIITINSPFDSGTQNDKTSYAISNELNNDLVIFLKENKTCKAFLYNSDYQKKSEMITDPLPKKYNQILGYTIYGNSYSFFLSNTNFSRFGVLFFDFDEKTSSTKKIDFYVDEDEEYIDSFNYQDKMYLITSTVGTSDLNLYLFDHTYKTKKNTVSFSDIETPDPDDPDYLITLNYLLGEVPRNNNTHKKIARIEENNPNAIETTSKINKLFIDDDRLILSIDYFDDETILCYLDLKTQKTTIKTVDKPFKKEDDYTKSNSYFFDDKLFQIASSFEKMKFTVTDLKSEKMITEYSVKKSDSITFKNSPIIQEGKSSNPRKNPSIKEMEKTSKYLKKITSGDLGISVYKTKEKYNVILGGTKEITNSGPPGLQSENSIELSTGGTIVSGFNSIGFSYSSYTFTTSTYIKCLFDSDFEHLQGEAPKNAFDLINEFEGTLKRPLASNVFWHYGRMHYGYFDRKKKAYYLHIFEN